MEGSDFVKLRKRLASLLLSAALIAGLLPAVTPQAQATESASDRQGAQFGYSGMQDGDHVLFGYADEASTYPISWKILDNDADNRGKSGAMLLFSDEVLGSSSYAQNYFTWEWYDCAASEWCAAYAESSKHFDTKWMQGRIRVVTKTWESDSWSDDGTGWPGKSSNICSYNPNSNVWEDTPQYGKMFCLSLLEARKYLTAEDYATFRYDTKEESSWWLRNCISYYNNGGNPVCYGLQYDAGTKRTEAEWYSVKNGMRPAFNFELPGNYSVTDYQSYGGQILLTAADETVKNPTGMYAVPKYAEGEDITWSMVVRDPNGHDNLQVMVDVTEGYLTPTAGEGFLKGQVTYPSYVWGSSNGITSTENEYLTAVMVDSTGKIAFMGTVGKMLYPTVGGFNIPIPTGAEGKYDVYIFNEHNDGTGGVRYASEVKHVATITVQRDTTAPNVTVKSYQREGDYSARITAQSDKDGTLFCSVNGQTESVRCYKNTPVEFRLENRLLPGTQTIEVWAKDAAGNESAKQTITFESYTAPVRASVMAGASALRSWNSVDGYDYLYLGTNRYGDTAERGAPTKWKVLDADATNTGSRDGLFILADKVPAGYQVEHPVFGAGAGAKVLLTTQHNQLTQQEQDALLATDLPWKKITTEDGLTLTDPVLSGQKLFLLSVSEAANSRYGFVSNDSRGAVINYTGIATYSGPCPWALRSTGTGKIQNKSYEVSAIVTENGAVTTWDKMTDVLNLAGSNKIANYTFIRPAANLNKSRVLMTSNKDGKSDAVDSALTAPADYEGAEWKLTLIDSGRTGFTANIGGESSVTAAAGVEVTITYSGAQPGENEYVSAMLLDDGGNLLYYGRLANNSDAGTVNVTVPEALSKGDYTLKVFSEQCGSGWAADYAGEPVSIALRVSAEKPAPVAPAALVNGAEISSEPYTGDQAMTLSTTSVGAEIWYTIETTVGETSYTSDPQQYTDPIPLTARGGDTTYTVTAWAEQYEKSSGEVTFKVQIKNQSHELKVQVGNGPEWMEFGTYQTGDKVTISAPEFDDQIFVSWFLESGTISGFDSQKQNKTITFTMPDSDVTLRVDYVPKIAKIELTMAAPTAGAALPGAITSYELKSAKGTVITSASAGNQPSIIWTVDKDQVSGTAGYGMTYTANITLYPKETAKLAFLNSVTATVNGENATVLYNGADGSVIVRASFRTGNATLNRVVQPAGLSVPYGTNAAIIQRGLPAQAELETDAGVRYGTIEWETIPEITQIEDDSQQTIPVKGTVTLPAGVDNPTSISTIVNLTVTIEASTKAAAPTVDVTPGSYTANQTVKLLSVPGAEIRYYMTSDGSEPAVPSASTGEVYSTPLSLTGRAGETVTYKIKALVVSAPDRTQPSDVATFEYKITLPAMRTVTVNCLDTYTGSTVSTYTFRYAQGVTATISAPPVGNAMFAGWTVDEHYITAANKNNGVITFTMPNEDVTLKANYAPVIRALTVTMAPPEAGQPLAATVTSCMADQHDITVYMKGIDWTPAGETAAYNTAYTAAIAVDSDNSAVQSAKFVFADNVTVTVNGQSATLDRESMTIYYTFPSTSAARLLSVTAPASPVNLSNGISKEDIKKLALPTKTAIAVEDGSANSAAIDWEDFAYDPNSLTEQTITVNGTVTIPNFVEVSDENMKKVSVTVTVAAAPQAPKPAASVASGSYNETKTIFLSTGSGNVEICYTTDGSTPTASSEKYTTPIVLTGGNQSENSTTIKAIAIPKTGVRMRNSEAVEYTYTIAACYPVTVNVGTPEYHYAGETVTLTAPPVSGKQFDRWMGTLPDDAEMRGDTITFTMPAKSVSLTAEYVEAVSSVALTITKPSAGTDLAAQASVTMTYGNSTTSTSSVNIAWSPSASPAKFNTAYTATVELTSPNTVYIFADTTKVTVNGQPASFRRIDNWHIQVYQTLTSNKAKLTEIPAAVLTGVKNGTDLEAMLLPTSIPIRTEDSGVTSAAVVWTRTPAPGTSYAKENTGVQTFKLQGTIILPEGIDQNGKSPTATLTVTVSEANKTAAPTANLPNGSTYANTQSLTLSAAEGATIYYTYTTDGTEPGNPTESSQQYTGAISLTSAVDANKTYTIKAAAKKTNENLSEIVTFTYTIQQKTYTVSVVDANGYPAGTGGGSYHAGETVTISTPKTGSTRTFKNWSVKEGSASVNLGDASSATTTFTMPAGDVIIQANFNPLVTEAVFSFNAPKAGESLPRNVSDFALYADGEKVPVTASRQLPITWTPSDNPAAYGKAYTATIVLRDNDAQNIVFSSYAQAYVVDGENVYDATLKQNIDGTYTVSCTFSTRKKVVRSVPTVTLSGIANGTSLEDIYSQLPTKVNATTNVGTTEELPVVWLMSEDVIQSYNPASSASQSFTIYGALYPLPEYVSNPDELQAELHVSVNGSGGSYSGGGSSSTESSAQTTIPVSTEGQSYKMPATVSGKTVTMKTVDQTKLDAFFAGMNSVGTLNIDFTGVKGNTTSAQIPAQILSAVSKALQEKGTAGAGMSIALPKGSAEFDAAATKSVAGQAGNQIQLNITDVSLSNAQKTAMKGMTTYGGVSITLTSNGKTISTFDGGTVLLKVPFTVPADQKAGGFSIWYVPENGAPEKLSTTYRNGCLETRVSHFSAYVIAYEEADAAGYANCGKDASCPLSAYSDLTPTAWYHDGVHYCLDSGLMKGVGDGKFDPTGTTSRAMVVTMLWRMADSPKATENSTFTDVPAGTWYTEAAAWGAENGIINGYNGAFDPGGAITREQLAAMLYRYAKTQGKGFPGDWMMQLDYPDAGSVSDWAYEAMCWMTMNGVINGKDGKLVPTGAASRAEAAAMLQRFCRAIEK